MDTSITKASGDNKIERDEAYDILYAAQGRKLEGDELKQLQKVLSDVPGIWKAVGKLGDQLRSNALGVFDDNTLVQESVKIGMEQMRKDLRTQYKSPVELLAIEQVITCWLQCQLTGLRMESATKGSHGFREGMYWEQRYTQSMNRLNRSMEVLVRLTSLAKQVR
jgi:hypothetical protein